MITGNQIKAARKLLGWSGATLAKNAGRSALAIAKAENSTLSPNFTIKTLQAISVALEAAGIEFILNEGGPGVRLQKDAPA